MFRVRGVENRLCIWYQDSKAKSPIRKRSDRLSPDLGQFSSYAVSFLVLRISRMGTEAQQTMPCIKNSTAIPIRNTALFWDQYQEESLEYISYLAADYLS